VKQGIDIWMIVAKVQERRLLRSKSKSNISAPTTCAKLSRKNGGDLASMLGCTHVRLCQ
jgi:hypothetical protein